MMMNPHGGNNRITGFLVPSQEKSTPKATDSAHCKECFVEMARPTASGFCPPCKANADKGKMGFSR